LKNTDTPHRADKIHTTFGGNAKLTAANFGLLLPTEIPNISIKKSAKL
jgi:hypothetical protein